MKVTNKLISSILIISFSLLSACGGGQSATSTNPPNADHIVVFDANGIATLRGHIRSGGASATKNTFIIEIPVKADKIKSNLSVTINLPNTTEISLSQTSHTNIREYLIFNNGSTPMDIFPLGTLVDISFQKKGKTFEAVSVREVNGNPSIFQTRPNIRNVFPILSASQGKVAAHIYTSSVIDGVPVYWGVYIPIFIHGVESTVTVRVYPSADTQVTTSDGVVSMNSRDPWGDVIIEFTREGNKLFARQITEIP